MSAAKKYKSYAFTVRPRGGVDEERIRLYKEWCEKQDGHFLCTEMEGESRHLHGAVYFETARTRSDVCKALCRIMRRGTATDQELRVLRGGVRIMYNNDFVDKYCSKDVNCIVISKNLFIQRSEYYPSEEEQQRVMERAKDPILSEYEILWENWEEKIENPDENLIRYFCIDMWFKSRKMRVPDVKRQKGLIYNVFHYITKGENL